MTNNPQKPQEYHRDYRNLRDLLAAGKWKEADEETERVMLAVTKREKEGWLNIESIEKFPCEDLRTIDQLWVEYSNGRFGFSVQKEIFITCGGEPDYGEHPGNAIWTRFCNQVGWRTIEAPYHEEWLLYNNEFTFSISAPRGHLPGTSTYRISGGWHSLGGWLGVSSLAQRLIACNAISSPEINNDTQNVVVIEEEISLKSANGWDYRQLNNLLKSGKWRAADKDTAKIMLALAGRTRHGYLDNHDINNFPSEDLRIIDHLWVKYSNGRFGFSVQKQIYLNCGGKPDGKYPGDTIGYVTVWDKFGDQVGWRVNGKWLGSCWDSRVSLFNFDTLAPCGHLPFWVGFPGTYLGYGIELADWRWGGGLVSLLSRQDLLASTIP